MGVGASSDTYAVRVLCAKPTAMPCMARPMLQTPHDFANCIEASAEPSRQAEGTCSHHGNEGGNHAGAANDHHAHLAAGPVVDAVSKVSALGEASERERRTKARRGGRRCTGHCRWPAMHPRPAQTLWPVPVSFALESNPRARPTGRRAIGGRLRSKLTRNLCQPEHWQRSHLRQAPTE